MILNQLLIFLSYDQSSWPSIFGSLLSTHYFILLSYRFIFISLFVRLGRLTPGGSKGPGIFFVLPCIEKWDDAKRQSNQKAKIEIENRNRQIKKMRKIECWKIRASVNRATVVQNFRAKRRCLIAEKPTLSIEWNCLEFGKCAHVLENEKFQLLQM